MRKAGISIAAHKMVIEFFQDRGKFCTVLSWGSACFAGTCVVLGKKCRATRQVLLIGDMGSIYSWLFLPLGKKGTPFAVLGSTR